MSAGVKVNKHRKHASLSFFEVFFRTFGGELFSPRDYFSSSDDVDDGKAENNYYYELEDDSLLKIMAHLRQFHAWRAFYVMKILFPYLPYCNEVFSTTILLMTEFFMCAECGNIEEFLQRSFLSIKIQLERITKKTKWCSIFE